MNPGVALAFLLGAICGVAYEKYQNRKMTGYEPDPAIDEFAWDDDPHPMEHRPERDWVDRVLSEVSDEGHGH